MTFIVSNVTEQKVWPEETRKFVHDFCSNTSKPRLVLGRNIYTDSIMEYIPIDGIIDDFTSEKYYQNVPIIKTDQVSNDALVINASGGRPLSAKKRLDAKGLKNLDYFAFLNLAKFDLTPIRFNEGFREEFQANQSEYEWAHDILSDSESKKIFEKLVLFRYDNDISHLNEFTQREDVQYFEQFLKLNKEGESFVDVGGYDGFTSLEFIKHCPDFRTIDLFEPDHLNFERCKRELSPYPNVYFHPIGLSDQRRTVKFDISGSASRITDDGSIIINVDRLDDVITNKPTFVKMDIEGAEAEAIEGAKNIILSSHPRLAISAYHSAGDFWRIPKQILSIRDDYNIYMRHYTECIYETVLFFIPKS